MVPNAMTGMAPQRLQRPLVTWSHAEPFPQLGSPFTPMLLLHIHAERQAAVNADAIAIERMISGVASGSSLVFK
jgi:hypothetical protein